MIKAIVTESLVYTDYHGKVKYIDKGAVVDILIMPAGSTYVDDKGNKTVAARDRYLAFYNGNSVDIAKREFKTID